MLLSICIPTHQGRAHSLREALDSVVGQFAPDIESRCEICVSDNGSMDETREVVESYAQRLGNRLVYHRHEVSVGFTANLLTVIEKAAGDFCWLLSSDDVVTQGGLRSVLDLLERHGDAGGATLKPMLIDGEMRHDAFELPRPSMPADFNQGHVYKSTEAAVMACGYLTGLFSGQIINRALWAEAVASLPPGRLERYPYFPHMYLNLRMLQTGAKWLWHGEEVFLWRDKPGVVISEMDGDPARFHWETTLEHEAIWADLLDRGSASYRCLMWRHFQCVFNPWQIAGFRLRPAYDPSMDRILVRGLGRCFWWLPAYWLKTLPMLLVPRPMLSAAAATFRVLKASRLGRARAW